MGIIVIMVVLVIMAVITTVVNILVLAVISTTKNLCNSQGLYKLSLAAADLLVGVVVLPTYIYNITKYFFHPLSPLTASNARIVTGYKEINGTFVDMNVTASNTNDIIRNLMEDIFPTIYVNFTGFMTIMSTLASIYTLAAAVFDRFFTIYKSFSYKNKANRYAKVAIVVSWILACFVSILPFATSSNVLRYTIHSLFIAAVLYLNEGAYYFYLILVFIPLILVWIMNIAIYVFIKKHSRKFQQKHPSITRQARNNDVEKRLAVTLSIMIGVFTFNTLPILITSSIQLNFRYEIFNIKKFLTVQLASVFLLLSNSFCNFFIYNARNKEFRNALKQTIQNAKQCLKKTGMQLPRYFCRFPQLRLK